MTTKIIATREVTDAEVDAALRVLTNWGGLRDRNADAPSIVKTMLMAAVKASPAVSQARSTDRIIECQHGFDVMVDGCRFGTWRSKAEAAAGLEVEQRRAAARGPKPTPVVDIPGWPDLPNS